MPLSEKDQCLKCETHPCQLQLFALPGLSHQLAMVISASLSTRGEWRPESSCLPAPATTSSNGFSLTQGLQVALDGFELKILLQPPLHWKHRPTLDDSFTKFPVHISYLLGLVTQASVLWQDP